MTIDLGVHVVRWGRVPTGVGRWQTWLEQTLVPNMRNEAVWSATFHSATFYVPGREAFLHLRGRFYIWGSDVQLYGSGFQDANIPLRYAR